MGHSRPRYNAKRRATSRLAKERSKPQAPVVEPDEGPAWARGMDVIVPDNEEKQRRRTELLANSGKYDESEKMSTKKKKRLDQYIEKKLKQERRGKLLKSLERSQATVHDRLAFISTSSVHASSSAMPLTQREELERRDGVESKKRERARDLVEERRGRGGYHSDTEEESDGDGDEGQPQLDPSTPLVNSLFSGAVAVEGPSQHLVPPKPAAPAANGVQKNGPGTGLAAGAKMVVVQGRKKRRKVSSSEDEEMTSAAGSDGDTGSDEEEEWDGISHGTEEGDEPAAVEEQAPQPRVKGSFRDWANARLREADPVDQEPGSMTTTTTTVAPVSSAQPPPKPREPLPKIGPMGAPLSVPDTPLFHQKTVHVPLYRTDQIDAVRAALPVVAEEDAIMDLIRRHEVVVICGETGSGKTTQVPQFLYEAGFGSDEGDNPGMIGVTQPRRVAAVSMASRVEEEMNVKGRGVVGHQIRYDATVGPKTKLKFMTDGVLLRELAADLLLAKYSVVIIDEAHERSVNTDVLIGVLSRVVKLRSKKWVAGDEGARPLRLVIMSATLRVTDFTENKTLFANPPPLVNVTARQHPVVVHFNRKTQADYVDEAYKKVAKIHARLPPGGVLVFLTGQNEITALCRKLEKRFGRKAVDSRKRMQQRLLKPSSRAGAAEEKEEEGTQRTAARVAGGDAEAEEVELEQDKDLAADVDDGEQEEDLDALDTDDEDDLVIEGVVTGEDSLVPMHILPLYSLLPNDQQMRVFKTPPSDSRLVIVSTNVAETSLTIPNIKYVVDAGRAKERRYDLATGVQDFGISWISKASAAQRTGRAGRTGPGHCYRLYSSAVYEHHFEEFARPEIARTPIEGVVLQMKAMNVDAVVNFPFPTPPDRASLQKAEATLANLGALDKGTSGLGAQITELGRAMASYPLAPRFARMLVSGDQHGCLPYVVALVSIFSVGDPFLRDDGLFDDDDEGAAAAAAAEEAPELDLIRREEVRAKEARKLVRKKYFDVQSRYGSLGGGTSDAFKALAVVGAYEYEGGGAAFCEENFVRPKAMEEIHKLRAQIGRIVEATTGADAGFTPKLDPPSDAQCRVLRQLLLAAFPDQVAVRKDLVDKGFGAGAAKRSQGRLVPYRVAGLLDDIFVHPSSVHYLQPAPEFVVYHELHRGSKIWIKGLTAVNAAWLPILAKGMCTFSRPLDAKDLDPKLSGQLQKPTDAERECFVVPKFGGPSLDVPLAPVRATQTRVNGRWVWQ